MPGIKMNKTMKLVLALVAIVCIVLCIVLGAMYFRMMSLDNNGGGGGNNNNNNNTFISDLPVRLTVTDEWAGGAGNGASATVIAYRYNDVTSYDTGTCDANGIWTTNKAFHSGDRYWIKVTGDESPAAFYYYDYTVPNATSTGQVYFYKGLDFYELGTTAITQQDPTGTAMSDADVYDTSSAGNLYPTFTVQVRNSETQSGYKGGFTDPVKKVTRDLVYYFKINDTSVIVKNVDLLYHASTYDLYGFVLNVEKVTVHKYPDGTYFKDSVNEDMDGIWTFTIQFDASGQGSGNVASIEHFIYNFESFTNIKTYGTDLSDASEVQATDFNFYIKP